MYFHSEITSQSILMVMECGSTDLAKLMHQHKTQKIKLEAYEVWYFWKKMLSAVKTIHDHGKFVMMAFAVLFNILRLNIVIIRYYENNISAEL